jgi:hypothetical protein
LIYEGAKARLFGHRAQRHRRTCPAYEGRRPDRRHHPGAAREHIKDRLEESETLQQQAQNNSLAQFSASPDPQNEFVSAVIGAMESHSDLSTQILNNSEISQKLMGELVPIIYKALKATA